MSPEGILAALPAEGWVEVVGEGELSQDLKARLGSRADHDRAKRPGTIIETSGEAAAIAAALQRVDDLGTIVLAGPVPAKPIALDLYGDLHVRGLTVVGITGG